MRKIPKMPCKKYLRGSEKLKKEIEGSAWKLPKTSP
jgi:hypothetical protein